MAHLKILLLRFSRRTRFVAALLALSATWVVYTVHSASNKDPLKTSLQQLATSYKKVFTKKKIVCGEEVLEIHAPSQNDPDYVAYELQFKQLRADIEKASDQRSTLQDGHQELTSLLEVIQGYYEFMVQAYANDVRAQHAGLSAEKRPHYLFDGHYHELNLNPRIGLLLFQSPQYKLSYSVRYVKNERGEFDRIQVYLDPDTKKRVELMVLSEPKTEKDYGKLLSAHVLRETLVNRWGLRRIDTSGQSYADAALNTCGEELVSFQLGERMRGNRTYDPGKLGQVIKTIQAKKAFNPNDFTLSTATDLKGMKIPTEQPKALPQLKASPTKPQPNGKTIAGDVVYTSLEADDRFEDLKALRNSIVPKFEGHYLFTDSEYVQLAKQVQQLDQACSDRYLYKYGIPVYEALLKEQGNQAPKKKREVEKLRAQAEKEHQDGLKKYALEDLKVQENLHYTYVERTDKDPFTGQSYTRRSFGAIALYEMNLPGDAMDPNSIAERLSDRALIDRKEFLIYKLAEKLADCKRVGRENIEEIKRQAANTSNGTAAPIQVEGDPERQAEYEAFLAGEEEETESTGKVEQTAEKKSEAKPEAKPTKSVAEIAAKVGPKKLGPPNVTDAERQAIRALVEKTLAPRAKQWKSSQHAALLPPLKELESPQFRAKRNAARLSEALKRIEVPLAQGALAQQVLDDYARLKKEGSTWMNTKGKGAAPKNKPWYAYGDLREFAGTSAAAAGLKRLVPETPDQLSQFYFQKLMTYAEKGGSRKAQIARELLENPAVNTTMRKFFAAVAKSYNERNKGDDPSVLIGDDAQCSTNLQGHAPKTCNGKAIYTLGDAIEEALPKVVDDFMKGLYAAPIVAAAKPPAAQAVPRVAKPAVTRPVPPLPKKPLQFDPKDMRPYYTRLQEYNKAKAAFDQYFKEINDKARVAAVKKTVEKVLPKPGPRIIEGTMSPIAVNSLKLSSSFDVKKLNANDFDPNTAEGRACVMKQRLAKIKLPTISPLNLNPERIYIKEKEQRERAKQLLGEALAVLNLYYRSKGLPEEKPLEYKSVGGVIAGSFRDAEEAAATQVYRHFVAKDVPLTFQDSIKRSTAQQKAPPKLPVRPTNFNPKDKRPFKVRLDEYYKEKAAYDAYFKKINDQATVAQVKKTVKQALPQLVYPRDVQERIALSVTDQVILAKVLKTDAGTRAPLLNFEPHGSIEKKNNKSVIEILAPHYSFSKRAWNQSALSSTIKSVIQTAIKNDMGKAETFCRARMSGPGGPNREMRYLVDAASNMRSILISDDEKLAKFDAKLANAVKSDLKLRDEWLQKAGMVGLAVIAIVITGGIASAVAGSFFGVSLFGSAAAGGAAAGSVAGITGASWLSNFMLAQVTGNVGLLGLIGTLSTPIMVGLWHIEKPPQERFIYEVYNSNHGLTGKILVDRAKMKESQAELRMMKHWTNFAIVAEVAAFRYFTYPGVLRSFGLRGVQKANALTKNIEGAPKLVSTWDDLVKTHGQAKATKIIQDKFFRMLGDFKRMNYLKDDVTIESLRAALRKRLAQDVHDLNAIEARIKHVLKTDSAKQDEVLKEMASLGGRNHQTRTEAQIWEDFMTDLKITINRPAYRVAVAEQYVVGRPAENMAEVKGLLLNHKYRMLRERMAQSARYLHYVDQARNAPKAIGSNTAAFFDQLGIVNAGKPNETDELADFMVYLQKAFKETRDPMWKQARQAYKDFKYLEQDLNNTLMGKSKALARSYSTAKAAQDGAVDLYVKPDGSVVTDPAKVRAEMQKESHEVVVIDPENLDQQPKP